MATAMACKVTGLSVLMVMSRRVFLIMGAFHQLYRKGYCFFERDSVVGIVVVVVVVIVVAVVLAVEG